MIEIITEIIKIKGEEEFSKLDKAAEAIKDGQVVAIPTETVYGLGANAFCENSAKKIYEVKGRPSDNPLIVHIADIEEAKEISNELPESFFRLSDAFWPGPLTMIVKKSDKIPYTVTAGLDTVGIRMPDNAYTRYIIRKSGCPIAAPSANISGTVSATDAKYVYDDFNGKIPYIIDSGNSRIGLESTVINLTLDPPVILRPGKITLEEIRKYIPDAVYHSSLIEEDDEIENPASPGMKYRHYSPSCPVILIKGGLSTAERYILENIEENEAVFYFKEQKNISHITPEYCLGGYCDLTQCAEYVFSYLRDADKAGYKKIYITGVPEKGLGLSIMNRLKKSAGGNIVTLRDIVFVCTGNTCRSPMAEFILKSYNMENLYVKSRGLDVCCMSGMAFNSIKALKDNDIPFGEFHSSQLTYGDALDADFIYTMTNAQKDIIVRAFPEFKDKVMTLKEDGDIADPYMHSLDIYQKTFDEIRLAIEKRFKDEL